MYMPDLRLHRAELDITVLITCYNEQEYIQETMQTVLEALIESGMTHEVIVIDDASQDNSVQTIESYINDNPEYNITLYCNETNKGLTDNYVQAAFLGKGKYYKLCCGDNIEPKGLLLHIFKHTGEADVVIPYPPNNDSLKDKSLFRKTLSCAFTFLVNKIGGYNIRYYNGLPVHYRYDIMRWAPASYGFGFQADLITRMLDQGATYLQIPANELRHTKKHGSTTNVMSIRNFLSVGHTLLEIAVRRLRREIYGKHRRKPVELKYDRVLSPGFTSPKG